MIKKGLQQIADMYQSKTLSLSELIPDAKYDVYGANGIIGKYDKYNHEDSTLIIGCRGTCGNVILTNPKSWINGNAMVIKLKDNTIKKRYLYYFLKSVDYKNIVTGSSQPQITQTGLKKLKVKIPLVQDQEKIINQLDIISNAIENRKNIIADLENLIESKFVEMFGNPLKNDKCWKMSKLEDVISNIENGTSFICKNISREGLFPAMLKLSAVTYGEYKEEENKELISCEQFNIKNEVHNGDLLFTRKNTPELVGKCAYIYNTTPNLVMPDLIFRIVTTEKCNKIYLWKLINHKLFRDNIQKISNGSARSMSNISKQNLKKLQIPVPPIELQNDFANFVQYINNLKDNAQKDILELELLQKTKMHEYFY